VKRWTNAPMVITVHAGVPSGSIVRMRVGTHAEGTFAYHVVGLPPTQPASGEGTISGYLVDCASGSPCF
jgi:hypothetical protein